MLDFSKLGDMTKIAKEARQVQAKQEASQREQIEVLKKISRQMDEMITLLKQK